MLVGILVRSITFTAQDTPNIVKAASFMPDERAEILGIRESIAWVVDAFAGAVSGLGKTASANVRPGPGRDRLRNQVRSDRAEGAVRDQQARDFAKTLDKGGPPDITAKDPVTDISKP